MTSLSRRLFLIVFVLLLSISIFGNTTSASTNTQIPWPTDDWQTSTPEEQGMDSARLVQMLARIVVRDTDIDSVLIVRNGYVVLDAYFYPFQSGERHIIHSCTKSIVSTLIGIAIDEGLIAAVDMPLVELFPELTLDNLDETKEAMTLGDFLAMASGLRCQDSYLYRWQGLGEMRRSDNWANHVLDLPMEHEPGTYFEYCNGVSHTLSTLITEITGMSALEYAQEKIFNPLGISDVYWPTDPQGNNIGWGEIHMTPPDMARFGYLFLNDGLWEEEQLVSAEWVEQATSIHIPATLSDNYGYQWWVDDNGYYMALGFGGQFIFVVPDLNIVAVFTSSVGQDFNVPETLLNNYIMRAVEADEPLPENPEAVTQIENLVEVVANPPEAREVPSLPALAHEISGQTYKFDDNNLGYQTFALLFTEGEDEMILSHSYRDTVVDLPVGLDGVYRFTQVGNYREGYTGYWQDDDTFVISAQVVGYTELDTWRIDFSEGTISVSYEDAVSGYTTQMTANMED